MARGRRSGRMAPATLANGSMMFLMAKANWSRLVAMELTSGRIASGGGAESSAARTSTYFDPQQATKRELRKEKVFTDGPMALSTELLGCDETGHRLPPREPFSRRQKWADGRSYEGQWQAVFRAKLSILSATHGRANVMNGHGRFRWPDGRTYTGNYRNGLRHGQGKFNWPDGRSYEGEWEDGKQHGQGTLIQKGKVIKGEWSKGLRVK
eukprot:Skav218493  [mRNA]  locus=scaffold538:1344458:1348152:- [translate_table: standard]